MPKISITRQNCISPVPPKIGYGSFYVQSRCLQNIGLGKTITKNGKPILRGVGSAVWSTDSIGRLAFLDNMLSFFIIEVDETGNFLSKDRELK
jgi:hypothetical protein